MQNSTLTGLAAGRALVAKALARPETPAAVIAAGQNWLDRHDIQAYLQKAAVSAAEVSDFAGLGQSQLEAQFLEASAPDDLIARLDASPAVPFTRAYYGQNVTGDRVPEGAPSPIRFPDVDTETVARIKHTAAIVVTTETLTAGASNPNIAAGFAAMLSRGVLRAEAASMLDPDYAGSLTAGVTAFPIAGTSAANFDSAIAETLERFVVNGGDPTQGVWITSPTVGTHLASLRSSGLLAFPTVTASGGTLAGLPLIVSWGAYEASNSPRDSLLVLVDRSKVFTWRGPIELSASREGSAQLDTDPTDSPSAEVVQVSLWQTNTVALKALAWSGWIAAPGSVQLVDGIAL